MIETKNKLKRIMTDLAAGHITKLEADELMKSNSQQSHEENKGFGRSPEKNQDKKNLKKRKDYK